MHSVIILHDYSKWILIFIDPERACMIYDSGALCVFHK